MINKYIDSTLLKACKEKDIRALCQDAVLYDFCAVCVQPDYVRLAKECVKGSNVKVATVIGFPLGSNKTETKIFEAKLAVKDGADELDMVVNHDDFLNKNYSRIINEINAIKDVTNVTLKVIVETSMLSEDDLRKMCELVVSSKADFIKTSTGFVGDGARIKDVEAMVSLVGDKLVKASGGIRSFKEAKAFIEVGAKRLGTSSGVKIVEEET